MRNTARNVEHYLTLSPADYRAALQYLRAALAPGVKVEPISPDQASTARLTAPRRGDTVVQLIEWTGSEFDKGSRRLRSNVIWVLTAGTPALHADMRAERQSYIDPRGAVRVELPWLLIDRTDLDPVDLFARTENAADPFADRSSLVVRTLLSDRINRAWGIRELAQAAGVGLGTASRVIEQLHRLELVDATRHRGRPGRVQVVDPDRVIDRWTRAYDWTSNESLTVRAPIGDPERFVTGLLPDLLFRDRRWALSLQAGAAFVARHAAWERVHVYIDAEDSRQLAVQALANTWTPSADGQLVIMRPYYRTSLWPSVREVNQGVASDLPVVSNLQLVLDLWHYPLRGREQAEIILDRVLRPIWNAR